MTDFFENAFDDLIGIEGDFIDDPDDSGGATRFGVTEAVARNHGYTGSMRDFPIEMAQHIYRIAYWDINNLTAVAVMSQPIAFEMFDTGANCGPGVAANFLQRSLNVLNRQQKDFPDIEVDGSIGPASLSALSSYLNLRGKRGEVVLMRQLNCLQGARYTELAERREKDERFLFGWYWNRVAIT